jgi:hypothetical protein
MRERTIGFGILRSLILSLVAVIPLALAAHAGQDSVYSGSREVRLDHGAIFDGRVLPAGLYSLSWDGTKDRDTIEVKLFNGHQVVATALGRLVDRDAASPYNSIVFNRTDSGDRELKEIRFAGSDAAISLGEGAGSAVAAR